MLLLKIGGTKKNGKNKMENKLVIVRTQSAGVFFGFIESKNGQEVTMTNARRLWYWEGAASLSQLAATGTTRPDKCKFPVAVDKIVLLQAIEIIDVAEAAAATINAVPVWKF